VAGAPSSCFLGIVTGDYAAYRDRTRFRIVPGRSAEETLGPSRENGMAFFPSAFEP
jgi:hypothetical protein